jgi:hypothetical protein
LRQIGLAFHNYHSAYRQLPDATGGTTDNEATDLSNQGRLGPLVGLLPFCENQRLWEVISNPYVNPETGQEFPPMGPAPWYSPTEYLPWGMAPNLYRCPGDDPADDPDADAKIVYSLSAPGSSLAISSYSACYGDGTVMQAEEADTSAGGQQRRNATNRGIFRPGRQTRFRDILDGLSNTILYSEVVASRRRDPGVSEIARDVPGISKNPSLCIAASKSPDTQFWVFGRGSLWADGFLPISGFQTVLPPNSPSCTSDLGIEDTIASASSTHPGGVHVLRADGAVAFASNSIDTGDITSPGVSLEPGFTLPGSASPYGIWGALGSRAGAETIQPTPDVSPVPREMNIPGGGPGRSTLSRWRDKSGSVSLQAKMVKIIDQKTIQLKSANGTIHEVPLNSLNDQDIYRAVMQDVVQKQNQ